jgi:uncharacterized membrane protein
MMRYASPHDGAAGMRQRAAGASARLKLAVALAVGLAVALLGRSAGRAAPLLGWDASALTFCAWTWASVWPLDAADTASHSQRENPSRAFADASLLGAAGASLIAVGLVLFGANRAPGWLEYLEAAFALLSVFLSWVLIHTVYTLKYARLYYEGKPGGVSFNEEDPPQYTDFAYLAFTIGMTFQVSDTDLQSKDFRRTALHHAWISFPLGAVIIAASVNLVAGLAK